MKTDSVKNHAVVSHEEWLAARTAFLEKEKEFTRLQDQLNHERRELPWEAVRKGYVFEGPHGKQNLAELFDGRSQLIVYHFMFEPSATGRMPALLAAGRRFQRHRRALGAARCDDGRRV